MYLSLALEYRGNCRKAIDFYVSVFKDAAARYETYREMPLAETLGISGDALDMIWKSRLEICIGNYVVSLNLADSLMYAMQNDSRNGINFYRPIICICHSDKGYVWRLFKKLYGEGVNMADMVEAEIPDPYGICWQYQITEKPGIHHCLSFDGFGGDVISFYERVFQKKAADVVLYADLPYGDRISDGGRAMVAHATLCFPVGDHICSVMIKDTPESVAAGVNSYDKKALLFYRGKYNPLFEIRIENETLSAEIFDRLQEGAKLNRPLSPETDNVLFGSLIDKYGICWNLYTGGCPVSPESKFAPVLETFS